VDEEEREEVKEEWRKEEEEEEEESKVELKVESNNEESEEEEEEENDPVDEKSKKPIREKGEGGGGGAEGGKSGFTLVIECGKVEEDEITAKYMAVAVAEELNLEMELPVELNFELPVEEEKRLPAPPAVDMMEMADEVENEREAIPPHPQLVVSLVWHSESPSPTWLSKKLSRNTSIPLHDCRLDDWTTGRLSCSVPVNQWVCVGQELNVCSLHLSWSRGPVGTWPPVLRGAGETNREKPKTVGLVGSRHFASLASLRPLPWRLFFFFFFFSPNGFFWSAS